MLNPVEAYPLPDALAHSSASGRKTDGWLFNRRPHGLARTALIPAPAAATPDL